jgi:cell division protein FtsN
MATRDYRARERSRSGRGRRGGGSGFFWFVTGAVFGAFGVGLAWMLQDRMPAASAPIAQIQTQPPTKPRFDFHHILPEMEVVVPDDELTAAAPPPPPPKPKQQELPKPAQPEPKQAAMPEEPGADSASYLVQVASFSKASDAERLKAKLALLGVRVRVQQVTVNGKPYHRVRAGPYRGKREVNKARALLSSNGLESIAIKLK